MPFILFEAVADIGFRVLASANMMPDQTATAKDSVCIVWEDKRSTYNTLHQCFACCKFIAARSHLRFLNLRRGAVQHLAHVGLRQGLDREGVSVFSIWP